MAKKATHFLLIHGAGHGAWCWNVLIPRLRSVGHKVSAIDLAGSGISPVQIKDIHSVADYIQPLMEFMAAVQADERVVLVGHSASGLAISFAMEKFPQQISVAVFLSAVMPGPNLTMDQIRTQQNRGPEFFLDTEFNYDSQGNMTSMLFGPQYLAKRLYSLSPLEDLTLATLLGRPYPAYEAEPTLTMPNYGSIRRVFIICTEDNAITVENAKFMIKNNLPDEVKEIEGADHMSMYSKPNELSSILLEMADKYD